MKWNPNKTKAWTQGTIQQKIKDRDYIVNVENKLFRRNIVHLKPFSAQSSGNAERENERQKDFSGTPQSNDNLRGAGEKDYFPSNQMSSTDEASYSETFADHSNSSTWRSGDSSKESECSERSRAFSGSTSEEAFKSLCYAGKVQGLYSIQVKLVHYYILM